jgi:hypothetical protein
MQAQHPGGNWAGKRGGAPGGSEQLKRQRSAEMDDDIK